MFEIYDKSYLKESKTISASDLLERFEENPDFLELFAAFEVGICHPDGWINSKDDLLDRIEQNERRVWLSKSEAKLETKPKGNAKTAVGLTKAPSFDTPPIAIVALGLAMKYGATTYERFNWRDSEATISIFLEAIMRHILDYAAGEDHAKDSKVHHLAHIMSSCAILLDAEAHKVLIDDRYKKDTKLIEDFLKILKAD